MSETEKHAGSDTRKTEEKQHIKSYEKSFYFLDEQIEIVISDKIYKAILSGKIAFKKLGQHFSIGK